jgi:23S rRNA (cytidine1920-2'-O)/16S rRNA (cytidine1409-2'-O)-methyltransferase
VDEALGGVVAHTLRNGDLVLKKGTIVTTAHVERLRAAGVAEIVVADLSFISLTHVIPALRATAPDADFVLLIKPQFEVGRTGVREGIVTNPALREDAIRTVLWSAFDAGLGVAGLISSPILGGHGNHEYLVWLSARAGRNPQEWDDTVHSVTGV